MRQHKAVYMQDLLRRKVRVDIDAAQFWDELVARSSGFLAFRFILQPVMASIYAIRDGRRDAREHAPAYFWAVFKDPEHRHDLLQSGWKSVGKVFILAVIMDILYQIFVIKGVRPVETLVIAVVLALIPYLLLRGPVNRLLSRHDHTQPRHKVA